MLKPLQMTFEELMKQTLSLADQEKLINKLGKSKYTRRLNEPEKASNTDLLVYSDFLKIPAYVLCMQYKLGEERVTQRELQQHKLVMEITQQISAA